MLRLTRDQVREIDRRAIEHYRIPGIVLMENAARAATDAAISMLRGLGDARVIILCGGGDNGGDGLAVARHLHNHGVIVEIVVTADREYAGDASINDAITQAMALPRISLDEAAECMSSGTYDLIVDALYGTGLNTAVRDPRAINAINACHTPVLAIDLPSGIDCNTGGALGACVRATRTITFVAEKAGFANPASKQYTGEITVGDIGCPRELIEEVSRL